MKRFSSPVAGFRMFALPLAAAGLGAVGCSRPADAPKATVSTPSVPGPAGSLHVDDGGSGGVPVVFVHGYAGDAGQWSAQLAHLRPTRRAVAFDLRGHGQSAAPAGNDYAVESLAADIGAVVDSLHLTKFVLVGHSMGGSAAIAYAGAHPERVAGLVMAGAPGRTPPDQAEQIMAQIKANYDTVMTAYWNKLLTDAQPAVRESVMSRMKSVPKEPSIVIVGDLFQFDPVPPLARYPGPRLAIVTAHETGPNDLPQLVAGLPTKVIAPASHWMQMDQPEEFNRILDEFLATVP